MQLDILLGLQWGDEGKGKIVDVLSPDYDIVARFQGGPNAGHTLVFGGKKYILKQIPSGIFHQHIHNLIGNGVVLDPVVLQGELEKLLADGFNFSENLFLSKKVHLILPTHKLLDACAENTKGEQKIGSTLRGISPTYQDKAARQGIRVGDLSLPGFEAKYTALKEQHLEILQMKGYNVDALKEMEATFMKSLEWLHKIKQVDGEYFLNEALQKGKKILAEGAQGTLLDVDFGSYPFVTSSNTITAGAFTGLGIAPKHLGKVYGIFKAYCTRVGSGPFPSEQDNEIGEQLQTIGHEFGSVTGRRRRCGWLDLPALKYATMLNGVDELLMMKADVLNDFDELLVCTHYQLPDGTQTDKMPFDLVQQNTIPIYKKFDGWKKDISLNKDFSELPTQLMDYVSFIEESTGIKVTLISVGPDRVQTIKRNESILIS